MRKEQCIHENILLCLDRTYTAISRISQAIGTELQSLSVIGSPIAWLFAQSVREAENGFSVTGGVFNYSAEIRFPETRHSATVKFQFAVTAILFFLVWRDSVVSLTSWNTRLPEEPCWLYALIALQQHSTLPGGCHPTAWELVELKMLNISDCTRIGISILTSAAD